MSQNTKTILSNLFTLTSELSEPTSKLINIEGANETPANQRLIGRIAREPSQPYRSFGLICGRTDRNTGRRATRNSKINH